NDLSLKAADYITDDSFEHVPLSITQWSIEAMRRHWYRQLNHLEFEFCKGLNYELFSALRQCTALTSLTISYCRDLTDAMALALIQSHPHTSLTLGFYHSDMMTDKTLDAIATHLPNIVNVDVENVTKITAAGIRRLIQQCPKLATVGCNNGDIYPSDFDDVDRSSMEIRRKNNGDIYVVRLYGEAFCGY
ncbi:hypothetical protein BCR42DRAFT_428051, partial [Absidia repens]